ncbi:hypothetical protein [Endothiovibrio diazotrophicus]
MNAAVSQKKRSTAKKTTVAKKGSAQSSARRPDLDWSQVKETVLMLGLAVAQIESSMRDGDDSVNVLGNSFTTMYGSLQTIAATADHLTDRGETGKVKKAIGHNVAEVSGMMQEVIMAMQFYDKLTQRLSHVTHSIEALGELIADHSRLYNPYEWAGLQEKIRAKYTTEEERLMFDTIMAGGDVEEALAAAVEFRRERAEREEALPDDNIDLF